MAFERLLASQLRKPSGWLGSWVVSRVMNRVNRKIVDSAIELLDVKPQHQVLEIGFGGGYALSRLIQLASQGRVCGVDYSLDMVHKAERRLRRQIAQGRVQVQLGDVCKLPFPDGVFNRVSTVNTLYFWTDPSQGMKEIRRVLKHDGVAAVGIRSKEKMETYAVTKHNFRLFSPEDVADLMWQAGFREVQAEHRDRDKTYDQAIIVGRC